MCLFNKRKVPSHLSTMVMQKMKINETFSMLWKYITSFTKTKDQRQELTSIWKISHVHVTSIWKFFTLKEDFNKGTIRFFRAEKGQTGAVYDCMWDIYVDWCESQQIDHTEVSSLQLTDALGFPFFCLKARVVLRQP